MPPSVVEFLDRANPAVLGSVRPDGTPHACAAWYRWHEGRALLTFDRARKRLEFIRRNPAVSLAVLGRDDWLRHVTLFGNIYEILDDVDLRYADELSHWYLGRPYPDRSQPRVYAWLQVERWFEWDAYARVGGLYR